MDNRGFWNDVLRFGAILGVIMGLSGIFETYGLYVSKSPGLHTAIFIEAIVILILFVWLLYAFARRRSMRYEPREGFTYAQALLYVICLSAAAGIIAGVMKYIFVSIIGFDTLMNGYIGLLEYCKNMFSGGELPGFYTQMLDDMIETVRMAEKPSILQDVFGSLQTYAVGGTVLGLVISGIVRRDPVITHEE